MKKHLTIFLGLALAAILAFTMFYCGGGGSGSSGVGNDGGSSTMHDVNDVSDKITDTLGEDGGIDAVFLAMDGGYSAKQIADAGMEGRLGPDGIINDGSGNTEPPKYIPDNIFSTGISQPIASGYHITDFNLIELRIAAKMAGIQLNDKTIGIMLGLCTRGYKTDQIAYGFLNLAQYKTIKYRTQPWETMPGLVIYELDHNSSNPYKPYKYLVYGGVWSSSWMCGDIEYPWRWEIDLLQSDGIAAPSLKGNIYFNKCSDGGMDGGKANYSVSGNLIPAVLIPKRLPEPSVFRNFTGLGVIKNYCTLSANLVGGSGPLYEDPESVNSFVVIIGEPPIPNLAEEDTGGECPEGTWIVTSYEGCDKRLFTVGTLVINADNTWDKVSHAGGNCMPDEFATWAYSGNTITITGSAAGCANCYYQGTVNGDCTKITGEEFLTCGGIGRKNCWEAIKIQEDSSVE